jgi:ABC-2 type transport system ATP-binding protein
VQQVCTRVAILKEGNLLAQGSVAELMASQSGIQLAFTQPEQLARAVEVLRSAAEAHPWLRGAQYMQPEPGAWMPPGGWALLVDAPIEHAAELNALLAAQGLYAAELRRREASLEQFFLALTGTPAMAGVAPTGSAMAATPGGQG